MTQFWGDLYTRKQDTLNFDLCKKFVKDLPKLPESAKQELDADITILECAQALETMLAGKAPGEDGITVAFYKKFWDKLQNLFQNLINEIKKRREIPESMNTGILRLLPKPNRDLLKVESWRPISLQGVDIKIIAKAIATKIRSKLDYIINEDQIGFRPGKYIGETIQLITELMQYTHEKDLEAYILSLDIEKAFDSVEWEYLDHVLEKFNFGKNIILWIKTLRTNASLKILNNGWTTSPMRITRGVRQGDPLSPYLFLLSIEPLASYIRNNKELEGIKVDDVEYKLSQFADDTTIYLANKESVKKITHIMDQFAVISGYRNNVQKTKAMGIGKQAYKTDTIGEFKIESEPITILGFEIEPNINKMRAGNMNGKIAKMKNVLKPWYNKTLTTLARIKIAKTLALSILTYPMMNMAILEKR